MAGPRASRRSASCRRRSTERQRYGCGCTQGELVRDLDQRGSRRGARGGRRTGGVDELGSDLDRTRCSRRRPRTSTPRPARSSSATARTCSTPTSTSCARSATSSSRATARRSQGLVDDGTITLNIHPISILDRSSQGTKYSTRAASAMYCVAVSDAEASVPFMQAMYANQPAEGSTGLTDDQILGIAKGVGVTDIDSCVNDGRYMDYVTAMTREDSGQGGRRRDRHPHGGAERRDPDADRRPPGRPGDPPPGLTRRFSGPAAPSASSRYVRRRADTLPTVGSRIGSTGTSRLALWFLEVGGSSRAGA